MADYKQVTFDEVEKEQRRQNAKAIETILVREHERLPIVSSNAPEKTKQTEFVLMYLEQFGAITPVDAMREFGIMRLASRISDLKRAGFDIKSRMKQATNRFGKPVHYAEYYVGGDD